MRTAVLAALALVLSRASAQQPAPLAFEVASVRTSQLARAGGIEGRRENIQATPGNLVMRNVRFTAAVSWAYSLQDYQVSGPSWVNDERYDIVAKADSPAPENQLREMLQALLAERFLLKFHRQTKEMQAFLLLIGKNGHKLTPTKSEGPPSLKPNGRLGAVAERAAVGDMTKMLSMALRTPVIDKTGLPGRFDFTIDMSPYITEEMLKRQPGSAPPDPIAIATAALSEQLGMKLELRKLPVELLVIDRAEKIPTEN